MPLLRKKIEPKQDSYTPPEIPQTLDEELRFWRIGENPTYSPEATATMEAAPPSVPPAPALKKFLKRSPALPVAAVLATAVAFTATGLISGSPLHFEPNPIELYAGISNENVDRGVLIEGNGEVKCKLKYESLTEGLQIFEEKYLPHDFEENWEEDQESRENWTDEDWRNWEEERQREMEKHMVSFWMFYPETVLQNAEVRVTCEELGYEETVHLNAYPLEIRFDEKTEKELAETGRITVEPGGERKIDSYVTPDLPLYSEDEKAVRFFSRDSQIVSVSADGALTALSEGEIKVVAQCMSAMREFTVSVGQASAGQLRYQPDPIELYAGISYEGVNASTLFGEDGQIPCELSFESLTENLTIHSENWDGKTSWIFFPMAPMESAEVRVTCESPGFSGVVRLNAYEARIFFDEFIENGIRENGSLILTSSAPMSLGAYLNYDLPNYGATEKKIRFYSSDSQVVTVTEDGILTVVGEGTATVRAYSYVVNEDNFREFEVIVRPFDLPSTPTPTPTLTPTETPTPTPTPTETPTPHTHDFGEWRTVKEATCTEDGLKERSCACGEKESESIPATGHNYGRPTYVWNDASATCTATCVCMNDPSHTVTETVNAESGDTLPATCEEPGVRTVTAVFTNTLFETQTEEVTVDPIGHRYGAPVYIWADGFGSCTATSVCENDPSHIQTETVEAASTVVKEATATEAGEIRFTASFTNELFETQTASMETTPLGHTYGRPTYSWARDNSTCTATCVCEDDASLTIVETVQSAALITKAADCENPGEQTFTATFSNSLFTQQSVTSEIPATGHSWGSPTYVWNENKTVCTATCVCLNDQSHTKTGTARVTSSTVQPDCEKNGSIVYNANFIDPLFENQTRIEVLQATGHNWGSPSYTWNATDNGCTASCICKNNITHVLTETARVSAATKAATCEENGSVVYTATFTDARFKKQTRTEVIPATGHAWGTPSYSWTGTRSCTATCVCENDSSHVLTEDGTITNKVTTAATCEKKGVRTYTAKFTDSTFTTQTKTAAVSALGHNYDTSTAACTRCGDKLVVVSDTNTSPAEELTPNNSASAIDTMNGDSIFMTADFKKEVSSVSYTTGNSKTVTIRASGSNCNVIPMSLGNTAVTLNFTYDGKDFALPFYINVKEEPMLTLDKQSLTLFMDLPDKSGTKRALTQSVTIKATLTNPINSTDKPTFKSSSTSVATVNSSGKLTAKAEGSTRITVSYAYTTPRGTSQTAYAYAEVTVKNVLFGNSFRPDNFESYIRYAESSTGATYSETTIFGQDGGSFLDTPVSTHGISYDTSTNTLTLKNVSGGELHINKMGSLIVKVEGTNKLTSITVYGGTNTYELIFTGTGRLTLNEERLYTGLMMDDGANNQWTDTGLVVANAVTLEIYGSSEDVASYRSAAISIGCYVDMTCDILSANAVWGGTPQRVNDFSFGVLDDSGEQSLHVIFQPS